MIESQVAFGGPCGDVTEFLGSGVDVLRSDQQVYASSAYLTFKLMLDLCSG